MSVHNHRPDEGRGLDCPERTINGRLRGACLPNTPGDRAMSTVHDAGLVKYAADVAEALHDLRARKLHYGEVYISKITFGFEDEEMTDIRVLPTEFDSLGVQMGEQP